MKMKRILTILAALCLYGCEYASIDISNDFWSEASYATIAAITGEYSMVSARWSAPIDLSGDGYVSDDILMQLQMYGWGGHQSWKYPDEEEFVSVLRRSQVLEPTSPEWITQINLFAPFPEFGIGNTQRLQKTGRCSVDIFPYQFHYRVDSRGYVILSNITDRQLSGDGGTLTDVKIRIEDDCIYFEADTSFYDWATSDWQDGHMTIIYQHN